MYHDFVRVAAAVPNVKIGQTEDNLNNILSLFHQAEEQGVEIISFPELSLTGYTCADLFLNSRLVRNAEASLQSLLSKTQHSDMVIIIGMPVLDNDRLFNCAIVVQKGKILGVVPKTFLPNNNEFYEHRWWSSGANVLADNILLAGQQCPFAYNLIFVSKGYNFSIELCEDLWAVIPPSSYQALNGSHLIFNLSASNELVGKHTYRKNLVAMQSAKCNAGYIYASSGFGESSTDMLFASSAIIAENGSIMAESNRFSNKPQMVVSEIDIERLRGERLRNDSFKRNMSGSLASYCQRISFEYRDSVGMRLSRMVSQTPFVPLADHLDQHCQDIFNIQSDALSVRLRNSGIKKAVIGISGGLDSTLALLATVAAFDKMNLPRKNIFGITMPGFGTTSRTKNNADSLMAHLNISHKEIPIIDATTQHFKDIDHSADKHDITYENSQARERTQVLMDYANKVGGLVIGTGDMSELALGWCTYNGDQMSMYAVNVGVPKTLVRSMVLWAAKRYNKETALILNDIADTPISPELLPHKDNAIEQKTEDVVGPYLLHDFFLYYFVRFGFGYEKILFLAETAFVGVYDKNTITHWLHVFIRRFFSQQFKRSCMPDGVKIGSVCLSPRGDWRMPSDASYKEFL